MRMLAKRVGVLFVCMGNICRSPTAEGVFRAVAARDGMAKRLRVDSAGTHDYHVGEPPDARAIASALRRGYDIRRLRARQLVPRDFARFDWILAMDRHNLKEITSQRPHDYAGHVGLLLDFLPALGLREVPDPYYGGNEGFERVLDLVEPASEALLTRILESAIER
jgi:low molecular weight protein-tyrosine phosphatase